MTRSLKPDLNPDLKSVLSVVNETHAGERLDAFLASQIEGWSRARLQRLIENEDVLVNGKVAKASYKLREADEIEVELVAPPVATDGAEPAWHLYVAKSERADELIGVLKDADIGTAAYYRVPAHLQPAMRDYPPTVSLPGTEEASRTNLALPMSPVLTRADADEVVAAVGALAAA